MKSSRNVVSIVAMLTLAALSVWYMVGIGLHVGGVGKTKSAKMVVADANGIIEGSRVLLRGIEIGHVAGLRNVDGGVELDWDYDASWDIPVGSKFRVDNLSALGEGYIAVLPQTESGPFLKDGATVSRGDVGEPTSFKELSSRLTTMLREVEPDEVKRIFAALDTGLPDGVQVIGDLNRAGQLLAQQFTAQSDNLYTLLKTMQPLLMRSGPIPDLMRRTTPQLPAFGTGFEELLASVRDATILPNTLYEGVMDGASPFIGELQTFLDKTAKDLNILGVNLLPAATAGSVAMRQVRLGPVMDTLLDATNPKGAITIRMPVVPAR